jgi:hypothetical protein
MKTLRICTSCAALAATAAFFTIAAPSASRAQAPMMCPMAIWQPVCGIGKSGKKYTWASDCWAKRDGAMHIRPGACK